MNDLRGAKLIASAILAGAGCITMALARPPGAFFAFVLFVGRLVLLARQWLAGTSERLMPAHSREPELEAQASDRDVDLRSSDSEEIYVKSPRQD